MARGFNVTVNVANADAFDDDKIEAEVKANGQFTEAEFSTLLPAARSAARSLMDAIGDGPFLVAISGTDRMLEAGEDTVIHVAVQSSYTKPVVAATDEELAKARKSTSSPAGRTVVDESTLGSAHVALHGALPTVQPSIGRGEPETPASSIPPGVHG